MNVNEYAQRVLFSDDLDEKIRITTETVDFDFQQGSLPGQLVPGRPASLRFGKGRTDLPSRPALVDDENRGKLLHFFANHELLAAELMALALLKFPDAPEEFRRGLFRTLQEEQRHTRWYVKRMESCGVSPGEYPVNRFFWDVVAPMETPFDYVSRLSLTFEQANLDYSLHYAGIMREAGDPKTARVMEQIYRDEIDHVGYGLKWFRRWKKQDQSDWQAYRSHLTLPLSPSRAKGNGTTFNRQGRLQSGLDEDFVRNLAIYEKSKGRSPDIWFFNPDVEEQLAHGNDHKSGPWVTSLVHDLEILVLFLSCQDDAVLLRNPPSLQHLERLQNAGFQLPEVIGLPAGDLESGLELLQNRKVKRFIPWSVSPELDAVLNRNGRFESHLWKPEWRRLFSKTEQARVFGEWMGDGQICGSESEIDRFLDSHTDLTSFVIKRAISAAGRGVLFVNRDRSLPGLVQSWLRDDGQVLVEPAHERVFDFSTQYQVTLDRIVRAGSIHQVIDSHGRYRGSLSSPKFCRGLPTGLSRFLMENSSILFDETSPLVRLLHRHLQQAGYTGPVGIDSYVYRRPNGNLALRPVCEINPRYTMGRVVHEIRKKICPGQVVRFSIEKPPLSDDQTSERLCLNEIKSNTRFAALLQIENQSISHP